MKTNDLAAGLRAFLDANPELNTNSHEEEKLGGVEENSSVQLQKKGMLHVQVEKKGRAGKIATFIDGFEDEWTIEEMEQLTSEIKKKLGTGGSFRENEILIQGNRLEEIKSFLKSKGFRIK